MPRRVSTSTLGLIVVIAGAWLAMTAVIVLVYQTLPQRPTAFTFGAWTVLYVTMLGLPLGWAVRLRRRMRTLVMLHGDLPDVVLRELALAAWGYLVLGYVCAVTAIGLLLTYVSR